MRATQLPDSVYQTTHIITDPGPEYADENRKFQGIPGIEIVANGRLWATWYGGGVTEDRHNYVLLATSDDGGGTWSKPCLIVDPDRAGPMRAFDPCLWRDPLDRVWLFWNQKLCNRADEFDEEQLRTWFVWAICAHDPDTANPTWSEPRRLCEGIMMNKPTVLSSGEWLLCSGDWFFDHSSRVFRSTDNGESWWHWGRAHLSNKEERAFDEHMVVERKDGSLWMLRRTKYGIAESVSHDKGRMWCYMQPSAIANVSSRFFIRRLRSGNLLLVKHGAKIDEKPEKRSHLAAFISEDDGHTWQGGLMLDERQGVSYPDGTESDDGVIHIIHDYDRKHAKEIVLDKFTERDIREGRIVTPGSQLGLIVNKATGINA